MSLSSGARLGSYEIVAAIGAGGMGKVLRARDTKLNHDVAMRVLPGRTRGEGYFRTQEKLAASSMLPVPLYFATAG